MSKRTRKSIRVIISMVLVLAMLGGGCVFAEEAGERTDIEFLETKCSEFIDEVEKELSAEGTSVYNELYLYLDSLENDYIKYAGTLFEDSINSLISGAGMLKNAYDQYLGRRRSLNRDDETESFLMAVAVAVAWFNYQGYTLSAELLTHAAENTVLYSVYYPVNGSRVTASSEIWNCYYDFSYSSGTGTFTNTSTVYERDLYYAIHGFTWYRLPYDQFVVYDVYDFDDDVSQWGIVTGYAVSIMYQAQQVGVLTPYIINIVV